MHISYVNVDIFPSIPKSFGSKTSDARQAQIVHGNSVVGAAVAYAMDLVYTARGVEGESWSVWRWIWMIMDPFSRGDSA